jgi:hypothetical protein
MDKPLTQKQVKAIQKQRIASAEAMLKKLQQQQIEVFVEELAKRRIKQNVDYALVRKYDQTRILCHKVWVESIEEIAQECSLQIVEYFTYE